MAGVKFSQVVGANVRRIRTDAHATQAALSRELVTLGLPWSSTRVAQLEAGGVSPTLPTLLLVAAALDNLTPARDRVTVVDLLVSDEKLELAPAVWVPSSAVVGVLRGGPASALTDYRRPWAAPGESANELEALAYYGRPDERVATSLGLDKKMMVKLSVALWGHNLSAERDIRAQAAGITSRVGKARITAALSTEVEAEWQRWVEEDRIADAIADGEDRPPGV